MKRQLDKYSSIGWSYGHMEKPLLWSLLLFKLETNLCLTWNEVLVLFVKEKKKEKQERKRSKKVCFYYFLCSGMHNIGVWLMYMVRRAKKGREETKKLFSLTLFLEKRKGIREVWYVSHFCLGHFMRTVIWHHTWGETFIDYNQLHHDQLHNHQTKPTKSLKIER